MNKFEFRLTGSQEEQWLLSFPPGQRAKIIRQALRFHMVQSLANDIKKIVESEKGESGDQPTIKPSVISKVMQLLAEK